MNDEIKREEVNGVTIQRLPTKGGPLNLKGARWKSRLTASNDELRALHGTILASEKKSKKKEKKT